MIRFVLGMDACLSAQGTGSSFLLGLMVAATAHLLHLNPASAQASGNTVPTVIRAGSLFDSEAGMFLRGRELLVQDGKITAVGTRVDRPAGARIVDLTHFTVLPGLIDAHTHLLHLEHAGLDPALEGIREVAMQALPLRALQASARARTFLAAGITTVRDLGNSGQYGDVALRVAIETGSVDGPRLIPSGPGLSPPGGQFVGLQPDYQMLAAAEYRIVASSADAADAVREHVTFGARAIKIYSSNTPNPGQLTVDEMRAIVTAADAYGVRVAAHATSDGAIYRATLAGVHSIEHGYEVTDSTLSFMAERGVTLTATDLDSMSLLQYAKLQPAGERMTPKQIGESLNHLRGRLRRALKAGVVITAGSDNYLNLQWPQGYGARRVLFAYREAGMTAAQVLQTATVNNAKLLSMEGKLGVLKPGAFADIIAVEGDPERNFQVIERVKFVMKQGAVHVWPDRPCSPS